MVDFIHLRTHSAYSLAESTLKLYDIIALCAQHRMPAVALTDTGNLFGSMEFCLAAAKAGIQPIVGSQILIKAMDNDPRHQEKRIQHEPILDTLILLAQSEVGYQNLMKIISRSFLQNARTEQLPYTTWDVLNEHHEGLICLTGGTQGGVAQLIIKNHMPTAATMLSNLKELFADRLYVEITRIGLPEEEQCEEALIELAYAHNIPLVATNEAFFSSEAMFDAHDALLCIAATRYVDQHDRRHSNTNYRFKSVAEMQELFADLPEALHNTVLVAQRCNFILEPSAPVLPRFPSERSEDDELTLQAFDGLQQRLESQVLTTTMDDDERQATKQQYQQRLDYELNVIKNMGFAGYFLIVADFIKWAKSQDIPVGPGRGSGAGSLVAWVLTITDIDPIRWNLLFERFLNPERISMPDFDVDFCQDRRDEVINYVCRQYGRDRVAQIITFGKLQSRSVVRDVGRVLGMPYRQVDRISKLIPVNPAFPIPLPEAIKLEPLLTQMANEEPQVEKLLTIAQQLEGINRHASTHAAGIVIGGKPLEEIVALYYDGKGALPATQYHMKCVELTGLVKFDFLGLKTLTVIQHTINLARDRGFNIDISKISLTDDKTFELLRRVEVLGVFQVESAGMRDVLRRLQPTRFEEIIALVALYRPGPMDDIPRYLACKNGEEEIRYLHPLLKDILQETFGVMVYQEQVMQIAQVLAGYSLGSADLLRRAMGKKIKSEMDAQRAIFVKGAQKNGIDKKIAEQIFAQAAKFAGYGFNKCHSGPYALISYQTAYLKANFPVEFMAASMTYDMQNTDRIMGFREELMRMNIPLLSPDVNYSGATFSVEPLEDGRLGIRYGLSAIKGISESGMTALKAERQAHGLYKNITDFARRLTSKVVTRRVLENLINAGAFDSLGHSREDLDGAIELVMPHIGAVMQQQQSLQNSLFGADATSQPLIKLPAVQPWSRLDKLKREFDAMGFYFSSHPLSIYEDSLTTLNLTPSSQFMDHFQNKGTSTIAVAGVVLSKKERISKKGTRFAFVQFSDNTGLFEVTIFSDQYSLIRDKLEPGTLMFMRLTGDKDEESLRLTVQDIVELDQKIAAQTLSIEVTVDKVTAIAALKEMLATLQQGSQSVRLKIPMDRQVVVMNLPQRVHLNPETLQNMARIPGINGIRNA